MSGKNIKPNIPSTETNQLPPLSKPNEEIDWIPSVQSTKRTIDFIFCSQWTGIVNDRQPVSVKQQKARQAKSYRIYRPTIQRILQKPPKKVDLRDFV